MVEDGDPVVLALARPPVIHYPSLSMYQSASAEEFSFVTAGSRSRRWQFASLGCSRTTAFDCTIRRSRNF